MQRCKHFFVNVAYEEAESPPWDGWCLILAREEALGDVGESGPSYIFFFFLRFLCSVHHFVVPDEVNNPGRNFQI